MFVNMVKSWVQPSPVATENCSKPPHGFQADPGTLKSDVVQYITPLARTTGEVGLQVDGSTHYPLVSATIFAFALNPLGKGGNLKLLSCHRQQTDPSATVMVVF